MYVLMLVDAAIDLGTVSCTIEILVDLRRGSSTISAHANNHNRKTKDSDH